MAALEEGVFFGGGNTEDLIDAAGEGIRSSPAEYKRIWDGYVRWKAKAARNPRRARRNASGRPGTYRKGTRVAVNTPFGSPKDSQEAYDWGTEGPDQEMVDDYLEGKRKFPAPFQKSGGVVELSTWGGDGAFWTRSYLRGVRTPLQGDSHGWTPATIEGVWYVVAAVRAMASGDLSFGFDDAGLKKAAEALDRQLAKVIDLYDS